MTTSSFPSEIEAFERQRVGKAKEHGFAMFAIKPDGDTPGFVYTIGLSQFQLPEILAFYPEDMAQAVHNVVSQVAARLVEGVKRFDRIELLRAVVHNPLTVSDPEVTYTFEFLRGDAFKHALDGYVTRAARYRKELGMPRGVLLMQSPLVPTFSSIRAERMLANS